MERILLICKKEDVSLFEQQKGFNIKTFDEFSSILLDLFKYDFIVVADLMKKKLPHMEYDESNSTTNCLAINGASFYGNYTRKELEKGISVIEYARLLKSEQEKNPKIMV